MSLSVLASCTSSSQGRRSKQEDAVCCHRVCLSSSATKHEKESLKIQNQPPPLSPPPASSSSSFLLVGVFDGHGGPDVASASSNLLEFELVDAIKKVAGGTGKQEQEKEIACALPPAEVLGSAFRSAIISMDVALFAAGRAKAEARQRRLQRDCDSSGGEEEPSDEERRRSPQGSNTRGRSNASVSRSLLFHAGEAATCGPKATRLDFSPSAPPTPTQQGDEGQRGHMRCLLYDEEEGDGEGEGVIPVCSPNYYPSRPLRASLPSAHGDPRTVPAQAASAAAFSGLDFAGSVSLRPAGGKRDRGHSVPNNAGGTSPSEEAPRSITPHSHHAPHPSADVLGRSVANASSSCVTHSQPHPHLSQHRPQWAPGLAFGPKRACAHAGQSISCLSPVPTLPTQRPTLFALGGLSASPTPSHQHGHANASVSHDHAHADSFVAPPSHEATPSSQPPPLATFRRPPPLGAMAAPADGHTAMPCSYGGAPLIFRPAVVPARGAACEVGGGRTPGGRDYSLQVSVTSSPVAARHIAFPMLGATRSPQQSQFFANSLGTGFGAASGHSSPVPAGSLRTAHVGSPAPFGPSAPTITARGPSHPHLHVLRTAPSCLSPVQHTDLPSPTNAPVSACHQPQANTPLPRLPSPTGTTICIAAQPKTSYDHTGTTVAATMVTDTSIVSATLGDSKTLVLRLRAPCGEGGSSDGDGGRSEWLAQCCEVLLDGPQHRLDSAAEAKRIAAYRDSGDYQRFLASHPQHGGGLESTACVPPAASVSDVPLVTDGRLLGQLNVSRGLGDFSLKHIPEGLRGGPSGEKAVAGDAQQLASLTACPIGPMGNSCDVFIYDAAKGVSADEPPTTPALPSLLIALSASDGLWDVACSAPHGTSATDETPSSGNSTAALSVDAAAVVAFLASHSHFKAFVRGAWAALAQRSPPTVARKPSPPSLHDGVTPPRRLSDASAGLSDTLFASVGNTNTDRSDCSLSSEAQHAETPPPKSGHARLAAGAIAKNPTGASPTPDGQEKAAALKLKLPRDKGDTEAEECPTPRGGGVLQRVADDLVAWAIHERNSSDNVSVVLVAIAEI